MQHLALRNTADIKNRMPTSMKNQTRAIEQGKHIYSKCIIYNKYLCTRSRCVRSIEYRIRRK